MVVYQYLVISDYYTGITLTEPPMSRPDMGETPTSATTNLEWNNQTITITFQGYECTPSYGEETIEARENGEYHYHTNSDSLVYTLYVPADYDGLVISVPREGYTEAFYNAALVDATNPPVLGPDKKGITYTPDQLIFFRVNENIR